MKIDSKLINSAIAMQKPRKRFKPASKVQLLKVTGISQRKLRIGENKLAEKKLNVTAEQIRLHNSHCDGYEEGWTEAMKYVRKYFEI